jgi:hypothetical protein
VFLKLFEKRLSACPAHSLAGHYPLLLNAAEYNLTALRISFSLFRVWFGVNRRRGLTSQAVHLYDSFALPARIGRRDQQYPSPKAGKS